MKSILLLFISAFLLISCKGSDDGQQTDKKKKPQNDSLALKVALMPTLDCMPFFVAQKSGIYDSLKLNVRLFMYASQMDCEDAYSKGKVEGFCTDLIRASLLQNNKEAISVVTSLNSQYYLVSSKSLRMNKISQLNDRMIAVARHSVTDFLSDEIVSSAKMKKNAVYRPQINSVNLRQMMVDNNQIDAALLPMPQAQLSAQKGGRILYKSKDLQNNLAAIAFSSKAIKDKYRAGQIDLLIKGYNLAANRINNNKAICDSVLLRIYKMNPTEISGIVFPSYQRAFKPNSSQILKAVDWLRSRRKIRNDYSGDTLFYPQFIGTK